MSQPLLQLRDLRREFPAGEETIAVLKDVNLDIHAGEMVAIPHDRPRDVWAETDASFLWVLSLEDDEAS